MKTTVYVVQCVTLDSDAYGQIEGVYTTRAMAEQAIASWYDNKMCLPDDKFIIHQHEV